MKKIIAAIAVVGALVFNASAVITITWAVQSVGGVFWLYDSTGGWPGSGAGSVGNNWVCQLVDAGTSAPDYNALLTSYQTGNWTQGTVLDSNTFDGNAGPAGFGDSYAAANTFNSHYLYIRFFNNTATQAGFIYTSGTTWQTGGADSGLAMDAQTGASGTIMTGGNAALGLPSGDVSGNGFTTVNPVPEPTSLALFGIGGLLIGLRRKLRKA